MELRRGIRGSEYHEMMNARVVLERKQGLVGEESKGYGGTQRHDEGISADMTITAVKNLSLLLSIWHRGP